MVYALNVLVFMCFLSCSFLRLVCSDMVLSWFSHGFLSWFSHGSLLQFVSCVVLLQFVSHGFLMVCESASHVSLSLSLYIYIYIFSPWCSLENPWEKPGEKTGKKL